jgi:hypothetical protein
MPRRVGTIPKEIRLTEEGLQAVQAWADQQGMSFSAAIETLARLGLGQAPQDAMLPAVVSVIRREIGSNYDRIIKLILYNIIESGIAARMASAGVKTLWERLVPLASEDEPRRGRQYPEVLAQAKKDARRTLGRAKISKVIEEVYGDGHHQGQLRDAGEGGG